MAATGTDSKPAPVIPILIAMVAGAFTGWLLGADGEIGSVKLLFWILLGFFLARTPHPHQGMDKVVKNPRVFADL
jgi:hypothetical protein